jgi:hypothetical protein
MKKNGFQVGFRVGFNYISFTLTDNQSICSSIDSFLCEEV